MLSIDPQVAAAIVLTEKPRISEDVSNINSTVLDKLIENLGNLSTVYNKLPEQFVKKTNRINLGEEEEEDYEENVFNLEEQEEVISKKKSQAEIIDYKQDTENRDRDNSDSDEEQTKGNQVADLLDLGDIASINERVNNYSGIEKPNNNNNDLSGYQQSQYNPNPTRTMNQDSSNVQGSFHETGKILDDTIDFFSGNSVFTKNKPSSAVVPFAVSQTFYIL